jgi:hypothetical protein
MNKINYNANRNYRDLIEEQPIEESKLDSTVKNLKVERDSKFENFKNVFKSILKKK